MSVQRSPPQGSTPQLLTTPPTRVHYNSDSAINIVSKSDQIDSNYINISKRQKRTFEDLAEPLGSPSSEIKSMFNEFKIQQDLKFESLTSALTTIINQNQGIQKSMETITQQYNDLQIKTNSLQEENSELKKRIQVLEMNHDQQERYIHSSTIEIRNIPKQINENKQTVLNIVKNIGATLNLTVPLQDVEIRDIYRNKKEVIVVDFTSSNRKEDIVSEFRKNNRSRRENKEQQINTSQINLPGPPRTIYLSEYLTIKTRRVFYLARELVKSKNLVAAWTSYGKVYVKMEEGATPVRIEEEEVLHKLIK